MKSNIDILWNDIRCMVHTRTEALAVYLGDSICVDSQVLARIHHHWLEPVHEHLRT
jgi:hypothetical protein